MHGEMSSIGDRIKRARKASGLSLRELGEQIGISHTAVSKYENGLITPSSTMLIKLARALGVRVEYFLRPAAYELSNIEYRKMQGLSKSELGAIEFDVMKQIERLFELESLLPSLQSKFQKMKLNSSVNATSYDDMEMIADEVRSDWGLGLGSISNLVEVIIEQGIRVIFTTVPIPARFDGLSAMVGETHLIVVSKNITGDRHRFAIAHELGHIVLAGQSISPDLDMERACNRF
ncbi:helix-turn-helix domain protein, partial [mine drainage metagenome]